MGCDGGACAGTFERWGGGGGGGAARLMGGAEARGGEAARPRRAIMELKLESSGKEKNNSQKWD